MRLLLDTHALLWWWSEPHRLSRRVAALIRDPANRVLVSAASAWEVATKVRIGRYPGGDLIIDQWEERLRASRFDELAMIGRHALRAGSLAGGHRDPFDRMLAAQSLIEGIPIASIDEALSGLGAERIWA